jgi:FMN phosphatase YigB (HAD superfamily)
MEMTMSIAGTQRPKWLTFDCYGTLIQWDEGLIAAVRSILANQSGANIDPDELIAVFDQPEHALEQRVGWVERSDTHQLLFMGRWVSQRAQPILRAAFRQAPTLLSFVIAAYTLII